MLKVLIAVDGSEHSRRAIEAAARLAPNTVGLDIVLVHVRETPFQGEEYRPLETGMIEQAQQREQTALLDAALRAARAAGLQRVTTQAEVGLVAPEIARAAGDLKVDMILLGTHGRGLFGGLLLGSVAQRVVHLATVPVLLVK